MKKHLLTGILLLAITGMNIAPVIADEAADALIQDKICKIGFNKMFAQDPKKDITELFEKHTKYANKHDYEKMENLYSDGYINSDGFDRSTYFSMIRRTWDIYPKISYTTEIRDITISGNYAVVKMCEKAIGEAKDSVANMKETGILTSDSFSYYYLQKFGNDWKITSQNTLEELTTLKYGDTKSTNIVLTAPNQVPAGEEYTVSLTTDVPSQSFILASITNEPIIYPQKSPQDIFRNIKKDGVLERVFKANKENHNEFATASIGITKAAILDPKNINIQITGMAFVMSRVNVVDKKNAVIADSKQPENTNKDDEKTIK